jgi:LysM repeat protein
MVGAEVVYVVKPGDSLTLIGAKLGADPEVIARANGLTPTARLHPGDHLEVDNRHRVPPAEGEHVVLNVPQRMLFFHGGRVPFRTACRGRPTGLADRQSRRSLSCGWRSIPRGTSQPRSRRRCGRKWQRVVTRLAPGPSNPLGPRYIGLNLAARAGTAQTGTRLRTNARRNLTSGCGSRATVRAGGHRARQAAKPKRVSARQGCSLGGSRTAVRRIPRRLPGPLQAAGHTRDVRQLSPPAARLPGHGSCSRNG